MIILGKRYPNIMKGNISEVNEDVRVKLQNTKMTLEIFNNMFTMTVIRRNERNELL